MQRETIFRAQTKCSGTMADTVRLFTAIFCVLVTAMYLNAQDRPPVPQANAASLSEAKATYESSCAGCHGLDARGSERGPDLASRPEVVHKTDTELLQILKDGKTSAGMPSFSSFGPGRLAALVAYLRNLQGREIAAALPGDPAKGKLLYFGKAKCARCHAISGQGGFFAQDLSTYAAAVGPEQVRGKILNPDKGLDPRRGLVNVTLTDSTNLTGIVRNEDNFSLQVQTPDGAFHLLNKTDVRSQTYAGKSGMPSDYGSTLSSTELDDLVSYLLRSSSSKKSQTPGNSPMDDED